MSREERWVLISVLLVGVLLGIALESLVRSSRIEASQPPAVQLAASLPVAAVPFTTSYQRLTSAQLATATYLPSIPDGARYAWIQVEERDVRWRNDSTAPTAALGTLIWANSQFKYDLNDGPLRLIRTADGATVNVWYERGDQF
jgi:hypothetical protein